MSFYINGWLFNNYNKQLPIHVAPHIISSKNNDPNNYNIFELSDFLLGYLDSYGGIDINDKECFLVSNQLINHIIYNFLNIPFEIDSQFIIFKNTNFIDFLGLLYTNQKETLYLNNNYLIFKSIISCDIPTINILKTNDLAITPFKNNFSDVGFDISIINLHKNINSTTNMYDTGIKLEIPIGFYIEIVPRSSIVKTGYILSNNIGIIDCSYKGNLYICLTKVSHDAIDITFPFKCCQLILKKQYFPQFKITNNLYKTKRNDGGFGSTT